VNGQWAQASLSGNVRQVATVGSATDADNAIVFLAASVTNDHLEHPLKGIVTLFTVISMLAAFGEKPGAMAAISILVEGDLEIGSVHDTACALLVGSGLH
jgi:hypothetical protein